MNRIKMTIMYTAQTSHLFICIRCALLFLLPAVSMAQSGRVGINTNNPAAALHVADSNVVFTENSIPPNNGIGTALPVSGPGARMMWHGLRRAFRAGAVTGNEWSADSVGSWTFAVGFNTTASINNAVAMGNGTKSLSFGTTTMGLNTKATQTYATAMGFQTWASGPYATATGNNTRASGFQSFAANQNTQASNTNSFAIGFQNISNGIASFSSGENTLATGSNSSTFGYNTIARPYAGFALGRFNDTTTISTVSWNTSDPLFIIGNGTSNSDRKNALTVMKNGNVGLFTHAPAYRLHVANDNFNDGGHQQGIMIENTSTPTPGEAVLSFRNKSMPDTRQWMVGINETPPHLSFAYGSLFTSTNTHMVIDTQGRIGINTASPQALLHVVRENPSGGLYSNNAMAIFESNNHGYIQLSSGNTVETGFLSGNLITSIRSAIVFAADSSIDLRAGGNGTDLKISTEGNVGVGIYTPDSKLHVSGTTRLGVNGTTITEIIKATINADVGSVAANGGTVAQLFSITNAALTSTVSVSQNGSLAAGLVIASARVSAAGNVNNVEVRFVNTTAAAIDPPAMDYHFTIIR